MTAPNTVRDGWRDGSPTTRSCAVCSRALAGRKARYCSRACQQRAYRLRQGPATDLDHHGLRQTLQRRRRLAAHTIYECSTCQERYLGQRRCEDCNRFCRALGLGGRCSECDTPILLSALLDLEVTTESTARRRLLGEAAADAPLVPRRSAAPGPTSRGSSNLRRRQL